jgi:hypothetical protein
MNAILYFHQGFTDIVNCLSLITFYNKKYNRLHVVIRNDFANMVSFYIRCLKNVELILIEKDTPIMNVVNIYQYDHILFIGIYDIFRIDEYKGVYGKRKETGSFIDSFYTLYNIDPQYRVDGFEFVRDLELENTKYTKVVGTLKDYILYHDTNDVPILPKKENPFIQLDHISDIFFDCIKILENAKEIHMIDSVWACFLYLIDCKYKLFHNKSIYVYCKRSYYDMFTSPMKLDHWIIL